MNPEIVFAVLVKEALSRGLVKEGLSARLRSIGSAYKFRRAVAGHDITAKTGLTEGKRFEALARESGARKTRDAMDKLEDRAKQNPTDWQEPKRTHQGKGMPAPSAKSGLSARGKGLATLAVGAGAAGARHVYKMMKARKAAKAAMEAKAAATAAASKANGSSGASKAWKAAKAWAGA